MDNHSDYKRVKTHLNSFYKNPWLKSVKNRLFGESEEDDFDWVRETSPFNISNGNFIISFCGMIGKPVKEIIPLFIKFINSTEDDSFWIYYSEDEIVDFAETIADDGGEFYVTNNPDETHVTYGWDRCGTTRVEELIEEGWEVYPIEHIADYLNPIHDRIDYGY